MPETEIDPLEQQLRERQQARQLACQTALQEALKVNKCNIDIVTVYINGQITSQEIRFKAQEIK